MKSLRRVAACIFCLALCVASLLLAQTAQAGTVACTPSAGYDVCWRITYSGADQTFTVPANVTSAQVRVWGAAGGGANSAYFNAQGGGAGGGYISGIVPLTPGQAMTVVVGQGGVPNSLSATYGSGGAGGNTSTTTARGGSGGGYSGIFSNTTKSAATALLIAGGGGGSSPGSNTPSTGSGGGGGSTGGQDGSSGTSGRGGTQLAGGAAATTNSACTVLPTDGSQFAGGTGASAASFEGGGGGGGGYFGGGGGMCQTSGNSNGNGGGGGGSSYFKSSTVTSAATTAGANFIFAGAACSGTAASGGATDPFYATGIGTGSCYGTGGNGEVVVQYALPKFRVQVVGLNGTGTIGFSSATNLASVPSAITITATGTATPASPSAITINSVNTAVTLTQTPPSGFAITSVSCSDANAASNGNTGTFGTFSGNVITVPSARVVGNADITCTLTEGRSIVAVQKISRGGIGTFTFSASTNLASTPTSISTTASGTAAPVSPTFIQATALGTAVTITENQTTGYVLTGFACTDANSAITGNTGTFGSFNVSTRVATIAAANINAGSSLTCQFTNSLVDAVNDDFSLSPVNSGTGGSTASVFTNDIYGSTTPTSSTVTVTLTSNGGLTGASINASGVISVPAGAAGSYTLQYQICAIANSSICDTANAIVVRQANPSSAQTQCSGQQLITNGGFESPAVAANTYALFTSIPGWQRDSNVFEIHGTGLDGNNSYAGVQHGELNTDVPTTYFQTATATGGAEVAVFWAHRGRFGSDTANLTITNNAGGSQNFGNFSNSNTAWQLYSTTHVMPAAATTFTLTFTPISSSGNQANQGNLLDGVEACQTSITLGKTELSRQDVDATGSDTPGDIITYRFTITNPSTSFRSLGSVVITDNKIGTINVSSPLGGDGNGFLDPGETWTFDAAYTLTNADVASGSVTNNAFASANTGANTISSATVSYTATLSSPVRVRLSKISNGGTGSFAFTGNNGFGSQTITTTVAGVAATGTQVTLSAANTATTFTETLNPSFVLGSASCTGLGSGGTATVNAASRQLTLNAAATSPGVSIQCTFVNNPAAPAITISKSANTAGPVAVGQTIVYTYRISNTGNVPVSSVTVNDVHNATGTFPQPASESIFSDAAPAGDSSDATPNNGVWDTLGPGDSIVFASNYVVTQQDIDTLQ